MAERGRGPIDPGTESEQVTLESESDRMRMEFLRNELQTCLIFVSVAETERRGNDPEHFARALADAEKGYETLLRFLNDPKHASHITDADRAELIGGLNQLRSRLDKVEER